MIIYQQLCAKFSCCALQRFFITGTRVHVQHQSKILTYVTWVWPLPPGLSIKTDRTGPYQLVFLVLACELIIPIPGQTSLHSIRFRSRSRIHSVARQKWYKQQLVVSKIKQYSLYSYRTVPLIQGYYTTQRHFYRSSTRKRLLSLLGTFYHIGIFLSV